MALVLPKEFLEGAAPVAKGEVLLDIGLRWCMEKKIKTILYLMNGIKLQGMILNFDEVDVALMSSAGKGEPVQISTVRKDAISTHILVEKPPRP